MESAANSNEPKFDDAKNPITQQNYGDRNVLGKYSLTYIFRNGVSANHNFIYPMNRHIQLIYIYRN